MLQSFDCVKKVAVYSKEITAFYQILPKIKLPFLQKTRTTLNNVKMNTAMMTHLKFTVNMILSGCSVRELRCSISSIKK